MTPLIDASDLTLRYGRKTAVDHLSFTVAPGRVVGLLGHNGAGKTSLMKALVGLRPADEGRLSVLGLDPVRQREQLLQSLCYIPDVATLPRWARVGQLITLMAGLHPRFSAKRARTLLARTSVSLSDKVGSLSKGMTVQTHLALVAAIDAKLMVLDEPTLGLDVLSRQAFYEMLIGEWCDGERSVLISTHQVEEIETLLSDVMMLNEGRLVLDISLEEIDRRYQQGGTAALTGHAPAQPAEAAGSQSRPRLVDLFVALTRAPELNRTQA